MRDPDRIDPTLKFVSNIWKKYPDLRLGQLICIVAGKAGMPDADPFHMEENQLVREIWRMLDECDEGMPDVLSNLGG